MLASILASILYLLQVEDNDRTEQDESTESKEVHIYVCDIWVHTVERLTLI